jgi:hypothetical protein
MKMKQRHGSPQVATSPPSRPGEGTLVRFEIESAAVSSGTSQIIALDLTTVPAPDKRFVADVCSVAQNGQLVKLYFGQCPLDNGELQSLIVIRMTINDVGNTIAGIDQIRNPSYEEIFKREGIISQPLVMPRDAPAQTVTLAANFAITAMSGQIAAIDFLQSSPFALAAAIKSRRLAIDPVVRVDLSSGLLRGLVNELRRLEQMSSQQIVKED